MPDLKERLEQLAEVGTPRGAEVVISRARFELASEHTRTSASRRSVGLAWTAAVALVVVLIVVVSSIVMTRQSEGPPTIVRTPSNPSELEDLWDTSKEPAETPGTLYLTPETAPAGMELLRVEGGAGSESGDGGRASYEGEFDRHQLWVRFDAAGTRPLTSFTVSWGPGATADHQFPGTQTTFAPPTDDPLRGYRERSTPVTVRNRDGFFANESRNTLVWEEPRGQMVQVMSADLGLDELKIIAEQLHPRDDGGFTVTQVPPDYQLVAESPGERSDGTDPRDLIYKGEHTGVRIRLTSDMTTPPGATLEPTPEFDTGAHLVDVRGRHAVLSNQVLNGGGLGGYDQQILFIRDPDVIVQWLEPGNVLVSVSSVGLTEDETLAIARSLHPTDQAGWERLMVDAPSRAGNAAASGTRPPFQGAEAAIADAYQRWITAESVDATAAAIEDGDTLRSTIEQARNIAGAGPGSTVEIHAIRMVGDDRALVDFTILSGAGVTLAHQQGSAVLQDNTWRVSRATYCAIVGMGAVACPPR